MQQRNAGNEDPMKQFKSMMGMEEKEVTKLLKK
jgi:hypothetical protein